MGVNILNNLKFRLFTPECTLTCRLDRATLLSLLLREETVSPVGPQRWRAYGKELCQDDIRGAFNVMTDCHEYLHQVIGMSPGLLQLAEPCQIPINIKQVGYIQEIF